MVFEVPQLFDKERTDKTELKELIHEKHDYNIKKLNTFTMLGNPTNSHGPSVIKHPT